MAKLGWRNASIPIRAIGCVLFAGALGLYTSLCEGQQEQTAPLPTIPVASSEPQEALPASIETGGVTKLEDVVVTATKRKKSSREIPVSVDAFSGEALEKRGASGAQDALLDSPGASVNDYYSPNLVTVQIRGTTTDTINSISGAPVGAFFGDIPLSNPTLIGGNPNIDVFDLATVEVLKGPQGTLFGGSALAGALRSTPNDPELSTLQAAGFYSPVIVSHSTRKANDYGVMINVPIGDALALRGVGVQREYPGAVDDLYDGIFSADHNRITTARGMLRWMPLDALTLDGLYHRTKGHVNDVTYTDNADDLTRSDESGTSPTEFDYRIWQVKAEYRFDAFSFTGEFAKVNKTDHLLLQVDRALVQQTPLADNVNDEHFTTDQPTVELRFVSQRPSQSSWLVFDRWDWLVGFFDYKADQTGVVNLNLVPKPTVTTLPEVELKGAYLKSIAKERALYFDLTRYLGEHFEINLGGRLFQQDYFGSQTTTSAGVPGTAQSSSSNSKDRGFNPKLALTWKLKKDLALRAAAVKGFRFGGININLDGDPNEPPFYKTDQLWNYELGLRSDWFNRRARFDITGFYIDWSRAQISQRSYTGVSQYVDNIGAAKSKGAEAQARLLLPLGFSLNVGGAYIDARTSSPFSADGNPIAAGTRLPGTPYVTASASLGYGVPIWRFLFDSGVTWNYQGKAFNNIEHDKVIPAYQLLGANMGLALPGVTGHPRLSISVANLLDQRAYNGVAPPVIAGQTATDYFPIRPRTIRLRVDASF